MRTKIGIGVSAPARVVFDLARDITRWPRLLPHYRKVTVESQDGERVMARMEAVRAFGPIDVPVWWQTVQWTDDRDAADLKLRFQHVGGATRGMDVTWHIRPMRTGSRVTIEHVWDRRFPLLPATFVPRLVDRLFVRPIAGRTLATFKALAESSSVTSREAA